MPNPLKILIVDDTVTYRSILTRVVEGIPNTQVVGTASNGKLALSKLGTLDVDLVLLDIEMPEMDGLETLQVIKRDRPNIGVIMISGMNRSSADITIRALEMGALDFIPKPDGQSLSESQEELLKKLTSVIKHFELKRNLSSAMTRGKPYSAPVKPLASQPIAPPAPATAQNKAALPSQFDILVIGVSTGGPNALGEFIPALPGDLNIPILLVQHMPPIFTESLANSLNRKSSLTVKEARDGDIVEKNTVYIAPGGKHMVVTRNQDTIKISTNEQPPENSCRPAVDVMFRSVADVYGKNILSLIMTGMGSDGALGLKVLKQKSCYSLVQSEKTCVVYGMPRAVEEMNLADERIDLKDLAGRVTQLIRKGLR